MESNWQKWKKQLLVYDKLVIVIVFFLLGFFRPDYVVICAYFGLVFYLIFTKRSGTLRHLLVSSGLAFLWLVIARGEYGYNQDFLTVGGFNLFPFFAWSVGLLGVYLVYSHYEHYRESKSVLMKFIIFTLIFWILLISAEIIAYHIFDIKNLSAANYAGLPLCECIHAPRWMQAGYFLMGPIFFIVSYLFKLENPYSPIPK